jgi:hypothetical protein
MSGPFDRFIGVDWSGAARQASQHVYVAEAQRQGARITLGSVVRARDREAVEAWLRGEPLEHAPSWRDWPGPGRIDGRARRIVALDFAFGFPAAFDHPDSEEEWSWGDLGRLAVRLARAGGDGLGSVRRAIEATPRLARQFRLKGGDPATMHRRLCDERLAPLRPESVFHLIGPSQVGIGSITGIAMLHRLRRLEGIAVWPLDSERSLEAASVVLIEAWPRMFLEPALRKNELPERVRQLDAWRHEQVAFSTKAELAAASSGDALDAAAAAIGTAQTCYRLPKPDVVPEDSRRREGWIAGVQVPAR